MLSTRIYLLLLSSLPSLTSVSLTVSFQERGEAPPRSRQPPPQAAEPDQEELDFLFDEEMEQMAPRKNKFTDWSDEDDSDYELDDQDVNKILIVTQTPPYLRKHPGGDRTGNHESRAKLTADLAKAINDGLFYYEQDLWKGEEQVECSKVREHRTKRRCRKRAEFRLQILTCRSLPTWRTYKSEIT